MRCNLFDVEPGFQVRGDDKPRAATDCEVRAYLQWLRESLGLPELAAMHLVYVQPRDWPRGRTRCIGATFGKHDQAGAYSVLMPGYNAHRLPVTMETLDDAGEIVAISTLPAEPKKGGVVWTREQVRRAAKGGGAVAKPAPAAPIPAVSDAEAEPAALAGETFAPVAGDDLCAGPMFKGEPWGAIFADIERGFPVAIECRNGVPSLVNTLSPERNGLQRTCIPVRHHARAMQIMACGEPAEMPASADFRPVERVEPVAAPSEPEAPAIAPVEPVAAAEPGFFVIDTASAPERAISHHATHAEAMAARDALEPVATYPGNRRTDGKIWRYMVTSETGPNDCRQDLRARTLAYFADIAAAAAEPAPIAAAPEPVATVSESDTAETDPIADLAARVAALEARLAALPAAAPIEETAAPAEPYRGKLAARSRLEMERERPKRSAAHERAIRRAWAARKARRGLAVANRNSIASIKVVQAELLAAETCTRAAEKREAEARTQIETLVGEREQLANALAVAQQSAGEEARMAAMFAKRGNQHMERRRRATERARRMLAASRAATASARQRGQVIAAELDKLRRDMADPSQPERASDIARLVRERDEARTACTALEQRAQRAEAFIQPLADRVEEMAGRLARAEAAARRAAAA